jgi:hypothetical protein
MPTNEPVKESDTVKTRYLIAATAATFLLAACSSGHSAMTAPTSAAPQTSTVAVRPTPKPTPKPSPTPTVWTIAQAGKQYLAIVKGPNAVFARFNGMSSETSTLEQVRAQVKAMANADSDLARALSKGLWPASVRPKIDAQIEALTKDRLDLLYAASAQTAYDVITMTNATGREEGAKAEATRIALGLPPAS